MGGQGPSCEVGNKRECKFFRLFVCGILAGTYVRRTNVWPVCMYVCIIFGVCMTESYKCMMRIGM